MIFRFAASAVFFLALYSSLAAQEEAEAKPDGNQPKELEFIKGAIGVWDAKIEVWANGPDGDAITFKGVETNRAYGEYWIASDFDSEFAGQTVNVHSIVGYDLSKKQLVGMVIDQGPYPAQMTGKYDDKTKTVEWKTEAKNLDGTPMIQRTRLTQKGPDERYLQLMVPGTEEGEFKKLMQITFTRRK